MGSQRPVRKAGKPKKGEPAVKRDSQYTTFNIPYSAQQTLVVTGLMEQLGPPQVRRPSCVPREPLSLKAEPWFQSRSLEWDCLTHPYSQACAPHGVAPLAHHELICRSAIGLERKSKEETRGPPCPLSAEPSLASSSNLSVTPSPFPILEASKPNLSITATGLQTLPHWITAVPHSRHSV